MELDFDSIKALSSPTRIKILNALLEKDATPTQLSNELEKSKSTVASHLSVLTAADLVEKDAEEGRRRVTYAPTQKAKAIVEGRERTVKFSIASSVLTSIAGIGVISSRFLPSTQGSAGNKLQGGKADSMTALTAEAQPKADAAAHASESLLNADAGFLVLGSILVLLGLGLMYYGVQLQRLQQDE